MIELEIIKQNRLFDGIFFVTHENVSIDSAFSTAVVVNEMLDKIEQGVCYLTYIQSVYEQLRCNGACCCLVDSNRYIFADEDIVFINSSERKILVVFYAKSKNNGLFLTACCNQKCIMCVQPPEKKDSLNYIDIAKKIIEFSKAPDSIVITGGEPTLTGQCLLDIIGLINVKWPSTYTTLLTNARRMSAKYVSAIDQVINKDMFSFGIPLHSDIPEMHDYIAGSRGAFQDTIRGLWELSKINVFIELRIVVSRKNVDRLPDMVKFIGLNLPFVGRVSIMQMEPCGFARDKWEELWLPVYDYESRLVNAVEQANEMAIPVLLYNYQLCCIPSRLKRNARNSISDWKNDYMPTCNHCAEKKNCGGFFSSQNNEYFLPKITPIVW